MVSVAIRWAITILCGVGLYAALFMLDKARKAKRGELTEPSVVQTPRARLFGPSNALFGAFYYVALPVGAWVGAGLHSVTILSACLLLTMVAALVSLYLAFSLLFVTRMSCPYCWTAHTVNWVLLALLASLLILSY